MKILYPLGLSFLLAVASALEETRLPSGDQRQRQQKQPNVRDLGHLKDGVTPRRLVKTYTNTNNRDRRIEFSDPSGKSKGWGTMETTDRTVTVEAEVEIVGGEAYATFSYGIRGTKHKGKMEEDPEMWIDCKTRGGNPADLVEEIQALRQELEEDVSEMCGEKIALCAPNFVQGILGYIETSLINRGEFPTLHLGKTRGSTGGGTGGGMGAEVRGPSSTVLLQRFLSRGRAPRPPPRRLERSPPASEERARGAAATARGGAPPPRTGGGDRRGRGRYRKRNRGMPMDASS